MGWFEHGSTAILFAPADFSLCVEEGATIRMGEPLMRMPNCLSMILSENRCPLFGIMP